MTKSNNFRANSSIFKLLIFARANALKVSKIFDKNGLLAKCDCVALQFDYCMHSEHSGSLPHIYW